MFKYIYIETSDHSNNDNGVVWAQGFKTMAQAKKFRHKQIDACFAGDPIGTHQDEKISKSSCKSVYSFGGYEFCIYAASNFMIEQLQIFNESLNEHN